MTSLVPQVQQKNREECLAISDKHKGETLTFEESLKFESFRTGGGLNEVVCEMWKILLPDMPLPYCMHSQNEDASWNFSWGFDVDGENRRSCFYTIVSPEVVYCREYPTDVITLNLVLDQLNVACVIISDLLQTHEWDKQEVARIYVHNSMAAAKAEEAAQRYQNRTK